MVGASSRTESFFNTICGKRGLAVTIQDDPERASELLRSNPNAYDWVIIEGDDTAEHTGIISNTLSSKDSRIPLALLYHPVQTFDEVGDMWAGSQPQQRSPQYHSSELFSQPEEHCLVTKQQHTATDYDPVVLEYHAPCQPKVRKN